MVVVNGAARHRQEARAGHTRRARGGVRVLVHSRPGSDRHDGKGDHHIYREECAVIC